MSNPVTAASTTGATTAQPARAAAAKKSTGASFAEVHAAAVRTSKEQDTKADATTATKTPKGEKTEKVDGHQYAEIVAGPRNGMFVNTSDNARSGQAFVMVKRDGRQFHIYGSGDDRKVFEVGREPHRTKATAPSTSASTPAVT
jgi:ribosomal protein L24E